jgi:hypothetical protein
VVLFPSRESLLNGDYDAMLHFGGKASRTIAFRSDGTDYQWLGEQESFEGPRMWDTPDGSFHEQVVITHYKQAVPGEYQGLTIQYSGPDENLNAKTATELQPYFERGESHVGKVGLQKLETSGF